MGIFRGSRSDSEATSPGDRSKIRADDRKLDRAGSGQKTGDPAVDLLGDLRRETDKGL